MCNSRLVDGFSDYRNLCEGFGTQGSVWCLRKATGSAHGASGRPHDCVRLSGEKDAGTADDGGQIDISLQVIEGPAVLMSQEQDLVQSA